MDFLTLPNENIDYLKDMLIDKDGKLNILPYAELENVPQEHISLFCVRHGIYCLPTKEMIDYLRTEIAGNEKDTMEIGAGNGAVAEALGISATDSFMQYRPEVAQLYKIMKQEPVKYGDNVRMIDGNSAVDTYKPRIVLACWVTHLYNPMEHWREGNMIGVDEKKILKKIKKYIFVGNEHTHRNKPILDLPHRTVKEPWLLSRSIDKSLNVIWIWER